MLPAMVSFLPPEGGRPSLPVRCETVSPLSARLVTFVCSSWTRGDCTGARGNNCRWRHFYQEGDRPVLQLRAVLQPSSSDSRSGPVRGCDEEFSSPLVVKVRREVARERREEFDLETGRRRSWVESREFEVLDLTGEISFCLRDCGNHYS